MRNVFGFGVGFGVVRALVVALAAAAVGCGGDDFTVENNEGPAEASQPSAPSTPAEVAAKPPEAPSSSPPVAPQAGTPPSVASTAPANAALGVKADTKIVIKFDRPMDVASVAAAYVSLELPADQVSFGWNGAEDELTITPNAPLGYSAGDANVGAYGYSVGLTTGAKDKSGLALAEAFSIGFSTLRRITVAAPLKSTLSGRVFSNGASSSLVVGAGDYWNGVSELSARALLTFDLTDVPDGGIEVESATFRIEDSSYSGTPDIGLGKLAAHHVSYAVLGADAYSAEPMAGAAVGFSLGNPSSRKVVVTDMVKEDLANRVVRQNRSQYRFGYPTDKSGDGATDMLLMNKSSAALTVVYLAE